MKIAKKVLAVVMAVALVGCFAVMAFAAPENAKITLTASEPNAKGLVTIAVNAVDSIGLASFDFVVTADEGVTLVKAGETDDHAEAKKADNGFSYEFNKADGKLAGYFKNNLWSTEEFKKAAGDLFEDISATFNANNFGLVVLTVKVNDGVAANVKIDGTVKYADESTATVSETVLVGKAAEVTTEAPTTVAPETTTEAATKAPAETTTAKTGDNDTNTGDNGVLAIVAGVAVLAGAAFVVSKKRK